MTGLANSPPYEGGVAVSSFFDETDARGFLLSAGKVLSSHRLQSLALAGSPPYEGGVAAASADGVVLSFFGFRLSSQPRRSTALAGRWFLVGLYSMLNI